MSPAKFYWAVVGDASPEPVAVVEESGLRVAYTCGCPDPFVVDGPEARIQLIHEHRTPAGYARTDKRDTKGLLVPISESDPPQPMDVPLKPTEAADVRAAWERELERDRKRGISHGHRRFNP